VQVFRERRASAADGVLPLTMNYRSRPEVLAVVNHLFGADFGDEFQPLAASGDFPTPSSGRRSSCSSPTRRHMPTGVCTGGAARRARSRGASAS
jgi:ATP-dependent exoDNAse (exonuclease V) beta subunit